MDWDQTIDHGLKACKAGDFPGAAAALVQPANDGHAEAQYLMADMYRWGNGVEQNAEKSAHFYKAAADQKHPFAAFHMALLLNPTARSAPTGMESVTKDSTAAKHYLGIAVSRFKELAEEGDLEAISYLGFMHQIGFGVATDVGVAIDWYTRAFAAGGHAAANNLALIYYEGDLRVRDKAKARFWYFKTKEFNCQCIGISEFESSPDYSQASHRKPWTIPGYEIFIRREAGKISLHEWHTAVEETDGVRLSTGDTSITNPKTGEVICIPDSGDDAKIFLSDLERWISYFRWRAATGDVAIPLTPEFQNPNGIVQTTARQLALRLEAQLIGDGGEVYD